MIVLRAWEFLGFKHYSNSNLNCDKHFIVNTGREVIVLRNLECFFSGVNAHLVTIDVRYDNITMMFLTAFQNKIQSLVLNVEFNDIFLTRKTQTRSFNSAII